MAGERNDIYSYQAQAFLSFISGEEAPGLTTLDEAVTDLAVADAWRLSSETGRQEAVCRSFR
jgi:predicted dehydrogenase